MKNTFTLWTTLSKEGNTGEFFLTRKGAKMWSEKGEKIVKLECRIVQPKRKPKRGKYPNDNFGLPAGYTPHNPDNLNREQVGEGYRLLADVEIWERAEFSCSIKAWTGETWGLCDYTGASSSLTYRVPINTPLDINPELKTK